MSKSHVWELMRVLQNIFNDAAYAYPTLRGDFEKDQNRLERLVRHRGIPLLVVDLPAICKHLDRCLSEGSYKLSGLPLTKRYSGRVVIPKFLRGLYLRVFDKSGRLLNDYDSQAIFFLRQILLVGKKTKLACSEAAVVNEVDDFVLLDASLPEIKLFWRAIGPDALAVKRSFTGFSSSEPYISKVTSSSPEGASTFLFMLDKVSRMIVSALGDYNHQDWRFRHGPGAVAETTGPSNKYSWTNWSDRLESCFPIADCGFHSFAAWAHRCQPQVKEVGSQERASRLVDVPKTYTKPRLIAAEPSEHQWCQQNIWHYFCDRSRATWIRKFVRFNDQTLNQELCRVGSRDGSLATVDLSAASDRVTCDAVGQLFRWNPKLLLALQASRTRFVAQELSRNVPALVELRKFSTMGSACTFPVESLLFLAVVLAAVLSKRQMAPSRENVAALEGEVAVFGDDLVIPVDSRELCVWALEAIGLKVNSDKSFWNGLFRESCGVDSYAGVNLTPAYWSGPNTGKPESISSTIEVSNNFYKKFLVHTSKYLESTIRWADLPYVSMDSGVCSFRSFVVPLNRDHRSRFNQDLQRMESRVTVLIGKVDKTPTADDSALLQYFTESPEPHVMWKSGVAQRPSLKLKRRWVPSECLVSHQA